jgi:hypothetical protein
MVAGQRVSAFGNPPVAAGTGAPRFSQCQVWPFTCAASASYSRHGHLLFCSWFIFFVDAVDPQHFLHIFDIHAGLKGDFIQGFGGIAAQVADSDFLIEGDNYQAALKRLLNRNRAPCGSYRLPPSTHDAFERFGFAQVTIFVVMGGAPAALGAFHFALCSFRARRTPASQSSQASVGRLGGRVSVWFGSVTVRIISSLRSR